MTVIEKSLLEKSIEITQQAGREIMKYFQAAYSVVDKSPDNPVTDADLAADDFLKYMLMHLLPEAGWLSEERADDPARLEKRLCWVVDPLDGTKEFVMGIPEFTVSVALVDEGSPLLGVILNPVTRETVYGQRDKGVYINREPVKVTGRSEFLGSLVDASRSERERGEFEAFERKVKLQTMGSIAYKLARVASGQIDATWSRGPKSEWDICAGVLLVQEAGGRCSDLDDQVIHFNNAFPKVNGIIASNGAVHRQLIEALAPHRHTARID
jgi:myo-inositol-1(or 4)-monophosphatase